MITIVESGMTFGPYEESNCFRIENSDLHNAVQPGVKIAEFLLLKEGFQDKPPKVLIIEAKSSAPNPTSKKPEAHSDFSTFIGEIQEKLQNALTLIVSALIGRHNDKNFSLPQSFKLLPLDKVRFQMILIVKGHKTEWLPPLQDALNKSFLVLSKTWNLGVGCAVVMNDVLARKRGLIL